MSPRPDQPRKLFPSLALRPSRDYSGNVTKLLEKALESARRLPPAMQDDVARVILSFAGEDGPLVLLTAEEDEALALSEAAAARGEFATDVEVRRAWAKHGF
jgi:hypothetical protein